jgi:hypothetical protein
MDRDIEKETNPSPGTTIGETPSGGQFEAVRPPLPRSSSRASTASRPRSITRTRSQNGYGVDDEQEDETSTEQNGRPEKDPFEVGWDGGDDDPLNPRSFSKARKWMITFIVAQASFCV